MRLMLKLHFDVPVCMNPELSKCNLFLIIR